MYKTASRNLQHAHRVDRIDPSRGFVHHDIDAEYIPSAENMDEAECRSELALLQRELVRIQQALAIAKRAGDKGQQVFLGHQEQALIRRRTPINKRLWAIDRANDAEWLSQAVKAVCDYETAGLIFAECKRLRDEGRAANAQ